MISLASDQDVDLGKLSEAVGGILTAQITAGLATCESASPLLCTVYFAHSDDALWFTSQETTRHVAALRGNPAASMAIWRAPDMWGHSLLGVQLVGKAVEVPAAAEAARGLRALHQRFPGTTTTMPDISAVYGPNRRTALVRFTPQGGTLIDEVTFGPRNFIRFQWRA